MVPFDVPRTAEIVEAGLLIIFDPNANSIYPSFYFICKLSFLLFYYII